MEQRSTKSVSSMGQRPEHAGDNESTLVRKRNQILEMGKEKAQEIKEDLPENIRSTTDSAVNWMRANPYKASSIGLLGLLSFRSKLARNIGMTLLTTAGTIFVRDKFIKTNNLESSKNS